MITSLWSRIVQATKAKKYLWVPINEGPALRSDGSYVRIFISEMFLETTFAWFRDWYPAVQASVQLKFGDQKETTITRVVKPPQDATKNGVLRNYEIMPLTPFNGGTLELQAALMAMQGQNYLGTAIEVLQDFSSLVAAPLGQALTIAEKVANGLDNIVKATNGEARLPYHDTFVGSGMGDHELKPGYLAIVRAQADEVAEARLSVEDGRLLYAEKPGETPKPFRLFDYILLRIDGSTTRDDYRQLSSIKTPYEEFVKVLEESDGAAVAVAERKIRGAVFRCADLARDDRARVWDGLNKEISDVKKAFGLGAVGIPVRNLDDIVATWAVPMAQVTTLEDQGADIR